MGEGRSLAETPTWSVVTVTTAMVAICLLVERSIYRFGKWLRKTKRKALWASLEKIREELMVLGIISLMLSQTSRRISEICVPSSSISSTRFYICSKEDLAEDGGHKDKDALEDSSHWCGEGREPFVSFEGLEQLHRFLFILGVTHVIYTCVTVVLAMIKIYSWRKWENQVSQVGVPTDTTASKRKTMKRQSTFVFHNASHPWSKSKILIWMLCFLRQFKGSITKSDYMALRLGFMANHKLPYSYNFHKYMVRSMEDEFHGSVGISWPLWIYAILCIFINIHGLNIYFWLSLIPAIMVMLVGTKLRHVVAQLAIEAGEPLGSSVGTQLRPRDELFWFRKPEILLWLIQFISFQNAFEMATFIWSLSDLDMPSCFMKNHTLIAIRLLTGVLVQIWCSYCTLPLNVIISQMGSKFKKALISENVRESLHSWCKRVKRRSRQDHPDCQLTITSTCSLESIMDDERDETTTVSTLSRSSSVTSLEDAVTSAPMKELTVTDVASKDDS